MVNADPLILASMRIRFVASLVAISTTILALAVFAVALFSHREGLVTAGMMILAIDAASNVVTEGTRIWLGLYVGRWIGLSQKPIWRTDKPARFWIFTAIHAVLAAAYLAVALLLILFSPGLATRL
jgi:hypothetical protein